MWISHHYDQNKHPNFMLFVSVEAEDIVNDNSIKQFNVCGRFCIFTALLQGENSET